jgi:hypothetical protein
MAKLAGHTEVFGIGELRPGKYLIEHLDRSALMGENGRASRITSKGGYLHREGADVHTDIGHDLPNLTMSRRLTWNEQDLQNSHTMPLGRLKMAES